MEERYISNSLEETEKIAEDFAKTLKSGDIVLLSGDLGAGKTQFTKGVAKGLGINDTMPSPTFTIMNSYENRLFHFDLYRLHSFEELINVGAEEFLYSNGISILEWPECVGLENFPDYAIMVTILKLDEFKREIVIRRN